MKNNNYNNVPR